MITFTIFQDYHVIGKKSRKAQGYFFDFTNVLQISQKTMMFLRSEGII